MSRRSVALIMITSHTFVYNKSYGLFFYGVLILCNFHSCTSHNSVIGWDIFKKCYRNVYKVMTMCRVQG